MQLLDNLTSRLVNEAQDEMDFQRRNEVRYPFFRPVKVINADGSQFSALSRNISETGIGLIHHCDTRPTTVSLLISCRSGEQVKVGARIRWSRPIGDDWFISGGELLAAPAEAE